MSQEIKICSDASACLLGGLSAQDTISTDKLSVACGFKVDGGTSSQFLKADGTTDAASYTTCTGTVVAGDISSFTTCTGTLNPSGTIATNDFAKYDASGCLVGRSCTETRSDLGINTAASCTAASLDQSACAGLNCTGTITGFDTGGDGITIDDSDTSSVVIEVDSSIVRTTGTQTIGGLKTLTDNLTIAGNLSTNGAILSGEVNIAEMFGGGR